MCEAGQGGRFRDMSWRGGGNGLLGAWQWIDCLMPCGWSGGGRGAADLKTEFQIFDEGNVSLGVHSY